MCSSWKWLGVGARYIVFAYGFSDRNWPIYAWLRTEVPWRIEGPFFLTLSCLRKLLKVFGFLSRVHIYVWMVELDCRFEEHDDVAELLRRSILLGSVTLLLHLALLRYSVASSCYAQLLHSTASHKHNHNCNGNWNCLLCASGLMDWSRGVRTS